jgi:TRAP-type C4-dicarboxylate transport system permease small subunit
MYMGESLAVFLVLLYDILVFLFVGLVIYCAVAKRAITASGWTRRDRDPHGYRRQMLWLAGIAVVLILLRLLPLFILDPS